MSTYNTNWRLLLAGLCPQLLVAALRAQPGCRVLAVATSGASVPFPASITAAAVMASVADIIAPPLLVA